MKQSILLCLTLLLFSCENNSGISGPLNINEINTIRYQETLSDSELSLRFEEVSEDSRCPDSPSIRCIWEGNAKIKFVLIKNDKTIPFELYSSEFPHLEMKTDTVIGDYRFEIVSLQPYPESTVAIPQSSYSAQIRVEKKNSLTRN